MSEYESAVEIREAINELRVAIQDAATMLTKALLCVANSQRNIEELYSIEDVKANNT